MSRIFKFSPKLILTLYAFRYLNILISIIAPDLIFVHNGTFTTSVILCCTNTFGRLVYI